MFNDKLPDDQSFVSIIRTVNRFSNTDIATSLKKSACAEELFQRRAFSPRSKLGRVNICPDFFNDLFAERNCLMNLFVIFFGGYVMLIDFSWWIISVCVCSLPWASRQQYSTPVAN